MRSFFLVFYLFNVIINVDDLEATTTITTTTTTSIIRFIVYILFSHQRISLHTPTNVISFSWSFRPSLAVTSKSDNLWV